MSDHTPTEVILNDDLTRIKHTYADAMRAKTGVGTASFDAEFDRAITKIRADAKAEALREAADKFQRGDWFNVIDGNAHVKIANGQRVTDWLRARADRLAS